MTSNGNVDSSTKGEYLLGIVMHKSVSEAKSVVCCRWASIRVHNNAHNNYNSSTSTYKLRKGYALSKCFSLEKVLIFICVFLCYTIVLLLYANFKC